MNQIYLVMFRKRKISPSIALHGNSIVRDSVQVAPNRYESILVDASGYSLNHPVVEMVTDLDVLRDAGIDPSTVSCSDLLTPTNPATLSQMATDKLTEVAMLASHDDDNVDN